MGRVISIEDYRRSRAEAQPAPVADRPTADAPGVTFAFDLRSAFTYLAAERVDRAFRDVRWVPAMIPGTSAIASEELVADSRARAEQRATALRMPLVWPERDPVAGLGAMRVAAYAAESGQAGPFALAAGRLAYCGGFDLDDPEILAEAAAAACLPIDGCLDAFGDRARDAELLHTGMALMQAGTAVLPALQVGERWFAGEERLAEAAAAARAPVAVPARSPAF